jgi:hypothetical protein
MRRVRLGSTVGLRVVVVVVGVAGVNVAGVNLAAVPVGVTAFEGADAGEVPASLVAVAAAV